MPARAGELPLLLDRQDAAGGALEELPAGRPGGVDLRNFSEVAQVLQKFSDLCDILEGSFWALSGGPGGVDILVGD